jgi:C4-dicarboxylate transporter/malic acid transport protein
MEEKTSFIQRFSPSWFASVMGTGILANASYFYSQYIPFLKVIGVGLFYFNVALFFVLLIPWILRWLLYRKNALADLEHPILSNFYATIAVAILVLSSNFIVIGKNMLPGEIFWFIGVILTILFGLLTPFIMFKGEHVTIEHINPAWFIPPVGLILIPIPGSLIISQYSGLMREFILFLNYFGWGAGFFFYVALFAICLNRFILHRPLPNTLAPTVWINLGPIGVGTIALINLVNNSTFITMKEPFFGFGLIFWGFGIWWVLMALMMTFYYRKKLGLPYALSWWAFTFPLGAYVVASHSVATIFHLAIVDFIGFALYFLLVFFWSITLIKTLGALYYKKI